ncbi:MAG: ribonuclease III domain-containing protein [bacterium]
MNNVENLPLRALAHIGDAVYELYIREKTVFIITKPEKLHKITVSVVNAEFQAYLLDKINEFVTEEESEIIRRGRNLTVTTSRRTNHKIHRLSTAFEALIGYLHLTDKNRLIELYKFIDEFVISKIEEFDIKEHQL